MEYEIMGLYALILGSTWLNFRLTKELAAHIQKTALELDRNVATAIQNTVENLPLDGVQVNPLVGIIGDVLRNNLNRGDNGRFVSAEILPPVENNN